MYFQGIVKTGKAARLAGILLTFAVRSAFADTIVATYEAARSQAVSTSTLCSGTTSCTIGIQNFDSWTGGAFTTDFGTSGVISGSYTSGFQVTSANQYGGAGGTGKYTTLNNATGSGTLTFTTNGVPGVNYFGLWFSALDAGNQMQFYRGTTLLYSFTPADFINLVGACSSSNAFCGNPTTNFSGQDSGEQFAFLNFFDTDGTITSIKFSQITSGGGFESDNHTVGYRNPAAASTGTLIYTPEPSTVSLLLFGSALLGVFSLRRRVSC